MQNFMAVLALMGSLTDNETLRFQWSSEQGFDTSCGYSAAVALMDTWWNIPVTELELLATTAGSGTADENYMVSFRSLSDLLASYGFAVKAYKMDWNQLKAAVDKYAPVLVHLDGYSGHFALVLGFDGYTAIVADPAEGTRFATKNELEGKWSGNGGI
jgi:ABC-type bacteriocin/lantibiotic exporter with double-glycine peptidase domain